MKQLYEASLRLKTDEDIAKIKEARAKRKEEEAEKKAQKLKRKQETTASWEQGLNNQARGSTSKQQSADIVADLDKESIPSEPPKPGLVRRMDYGNIQRQPENQPPLEELRTENGLISDAQWREDKTTKQNLSIRPSLFE